MTRRAKREKDDPHATHGVWTNAQKWITGGITMLAALMALLVNAKNLGVSSYMGFLTLNVADDAAHRIVFAPQADTLRALGEPTVLTATVTDARGAALAGATLRWRSSDTSVVTVDSSGLIVARGTGRAQVEASVRGIVATAALLVRQEPEHLRIAGDSLLRVPDGESRALSAVVLDARGHPLPLAKPRWGSADPAIAAIDSTGRLHAAASGRAVVWAEFGALRDTLPVEVVLTPAALAVVSGEGQRALAGRTLASLLVLRVLTRAGVPVPGVNVTLATEDGEGALAPDAATTDAEGRVRTAWTLGAKAGRQRLLARAPMLDSALVVEADADPTPGNARVEVVSTELRGPVGMALAAPVRVRVTDSAGTALAAVRIAWSTLDGGSVTGADRTDSLGVAEAKWTLGTRAGTQRLLAQVGNPRFIPASDVRATADAGRAVALEVRGGDRQRGAAGTVLATPLLVQVRDSLGNPVAGSRVLAKAAHGLLSDTVLTTDERGIATARWTLGTRPGAQRAEFSLAGRNIKVTVNATARVGALAAVTIRAATTRATGPQRFEATATDEHGNAVSGAMLQFAANAGALSVAQAKTDTRGVATVTWTKPTTLRSEARITVRASGTRVAATHVVPAAPVAARAAARP